MFQYFQENKHAHALLVFYTDRLVEQIQAAKLPSPISSSVYQEINRANFYNTFNPARVKSRERENGCIQILGNEIQ